LLPLRRCPDGHKGQLFALIYVFRR
jgi:hypothetical protein